MRPRCCTASLIVGTGFPYRRRFGDSGIHEHRLVATRTRFRDDSGARHINASKEMDPGVPAAGYLKTTRSIRVVRFEPVDDMYAMCRRNATILRPTGRRTTWRDSGTGARPTSNERRQ